MNDKEFDDMIKKALSKNPKPKNDFHFSKWIYITGVAVAIIGYTCLVAMLFKKGIEEEVSSKEYDFYMEWSGSDKATMVITDPVIIPKSLMDSFKLMYKGEEVKPYYSKKDTIKQQ